MLHSPSDLALLRIATDCPPNFESWEWALGDGAFKGNHHFLCKYEQPANGLLEEWQVKFNVIVNHFRVRVEQVIGMVKRHSMLQGVFRGSYVLLKAVLDLTVQLTNLKIRLLPPRFRTIGPWPHNPHSASALGKRKRDDTDDGDIEIF